MTVRAKFRCVNVRGTAVDSKHIILQPVIGGSEENEQFFHYTPGGLIELQCVNEAASQQFVVGEEYFVDFTPASRPAETVESKGHDATDPPV